MPNKYPSLLHWFLRSKDRGQPGEPVNFEDDLMFGDFTRDIIERYYFWENGTDVSAGKQVDIMGEPDENKLIPPYLRADSAGLELDFQTARLHELLLRTGVAFEAILQNRAGVEVKASRLPEKGAHEPGWRYDCMPLETHSTVNRRLPEVDSGLPDGDPNDPNSMNGSLLTSTSKWWFHAWFYWDFPEEWLAAGVPNVKPWQRPVDPDRIMLDVRYFCTPFLREQLIQAPWYHLKGYDQQTRKSGHVYRSRGRKLPLWDAIPEKLRRFWPQAPVIIPVSNWDLERFFTRRQDDPKYAGYWQHLQDEYAQWCAKIPKGGS
jgi:hypothetical protein